MGKPENSVMKAVEQVCQVYRIPCFRINSRVIDVVDKRKPSGFRPFMIGQWKDELGNKHNGGMADLLLSPRLSACDLFVDLHCYSGPNDIAVPLWVETKYKSGLQSAEQKNFQRYVEASGMYYLLCRDSADALLEWFKTHGVTR